MTTKKKLENICEDLSKNLPFRMSLNAKELFHSNMLQWILLSDFLNSSSLQCLFSKPEGFYIYDVLREKNNLDLIIVFSDLSDEEFEILSKKDADNHFKFVVLENKFKSIPYKEQLEKYSELIKKEFTVIDIVIKDGRKMHIKMNESNCIAKYLVAPKASLNIIKNELYDWKPISYESIATEIKKISTNCSDKFVKEYLFQYAIFLEKMLAFTSIVIKDCDNILPSKDLIEIARTIKINDFYEKLWFSIKLGKINEQLLKNNIAIAIKNSSYTHSVGLLEWKIEYKNRNNSYLYLGIQIQGSQFCVSVEPKWGLNYIDNDDSKREKEIINWISSILNSIPVQYKNLFFENDNGEFVKMKNNSSLYSYNSYKYLYCKIRQDLSNIDNQKYYELISRVLKLIHKNKYNIFTKKHFQTS